MEETDVCYPTPAVRCLQQAIPNSCPAKALPPSQRLQIGLQALAGTQTVTGIADEFDVSRKFVSRQSAIAGANEGSSRTATQLPRRDQRQLCAGPARPRRCGLEARVNGNRSNLFIASEI